MKPSPLRTWVKRLHQSVDSLYSRLVGAAPLGKEISHQRERLSFECFSDFTYSRHSHFGRFLIPESYRGLSRRTCDLKTYQDLFTYTLICDNLPAGARLLEIGGGNSRVARWLEGQFEIWNLDKLEGAGHGPVAGAGEHEPRLVRDYIGSFNQALADHSFDCVFSISTMEHVPEDRSTFADILADTRRLLKPGGVCFHTIDIVLKDGGFWPHRFIDYLYESNVPLNPRVPVEQISADPDLWMLSAYAYYSHWFARTRRPFNAFGRPVAYQVWWR